MVVLFGCLFHGATECSTAGSVFALGAKGHGFESRHSENDATLSIAGPIRFYDGIGKHDRLKIYCHRHDIQVQILLEAQKAGVHL